MRKTIWWLLAAVAVVSLWSWRHRAAPDAVDDDLLLDRLWLDHAPRGERDVVNLFVATSNESVGVFAKGTVWRYSMEAFRFEAESGKLRVLYPQTGDRETVRAQARECDEAGMNFCLELKGASRGIRRYYSMHGWEIGGSKTREAIERKLAELAASAQ